jgi:hypothetical protein
MINDSFDNRFSFYTLVAFSSLLVAVVLTWIWVIEEPFYYFDEEYPIWMAKSQLAHENLKGKLVILGDSGPVAGMVPARIGPGVVNLALPGSTAIENLYFAQNIIGASEHPAAVIISFSPIQIVEADFFWSRSVEFGFLNLQQLNEVRIRSRAIDDESLFGVRTPLDFDAQFKSLLYASKFPSFYFPAIVASRFYQRHEANEKRFQLTLAHRGQEYFGVAQGSIELDRETALKSFIPSKILDDYFNRLLAFFYSQNIPVYFLSLPHNAASDRHYFPGFKEAFSHYLGPYTQRYPNFHILGDPFPVYASEYFGDRSHLNEPGATKWSDHVVQLLNESRVPGGPFGTGLDASP